MRAAEKYTAVLMSYRLVESEAKKSAHSKLIDKIVYSLDPLVILGPYTVSTL